MVVRYTDHHGPRTGAGVVCAEALGGLLADSVSGQCEQQSELAALRFERGSNPFGIL